MSSKHLQSGDAKPAFNNEKKFRIYSMQFCPFAQRARLVLTSKGITGYDLVNIKLRNELPEWYPAINPLRAVPAIEFSDGEAIYESFIVADLLDELYPQKQLHPKDPKEKARQKLFLESFGKSFIPSYYTNLKERSDETKQELLKNLMNAEEYLARNKTKYFAGNEAAGMSDFMVWPWFERLPVMHTLSADVHPNLTKWFNLMHDEPAVKQTAFSRENHLKFYEGYGKGAVDYDFV